MNVVLCHGTFDLFHYGHLLYLEAARALGDRLIVSVTADAFVNKGPGRPIFNENERAQMIAALKIVDGVVICRAPNSIHVIEELRPQVYAKGADYKTQDKHGYLEAERAAVESFGGRLVLIDQPLWSSSNLIARVRAAA